MTDWKLRETELERYFVVPRVAVPILELALEDLASVVIVDPQLL